MSSEMLRVDNLRQRLFCNSVLDAKRESRCPVCNAMFSTTYSMRLHLQTVHMDLEPQNLSAKTFYREFNNNNNNNNNTNINNNNNNNSSFVIKSSPAKIFVNNNNNSPEQAHVTPVKSSLYNNDSTCSTDFSDGYPSDKDSYFGNSPKDDIPLSVTCNGFASSHSSPVSKRSGNNNNNNNNSNNHHHHHHNNHVKTKRTYTCRLCSTVFGNLRALKGHNSSSHNKSTNGLYACNICEFASTEKASLNHHMKGHTGETPYVCKKCSYAFTTKANCERHLRTIHKASNAEVKTSILFKNEEKSTSSSSTSAAATQQQHPSTNEEIAIAAAAAAAAATRRRRSGGHESSAATTMMMMMDCSQYGSSGGHKSSAEDDDEEFEYDEPLDLSVKRFKPDPDCEPQDLSVNGCKRFDNCLTDEEDMKSSFREQFVPQGPPPSYMDLNIPTPLHAYFLNEHRMFFNGIYPSAERMLPIPLTVDMIRAMRQMNDPTPLPPVSQQQQPSPIRQPSPVTDPLLLPSAIKCESPDEPTVVAPSLPLPQVEDVASQKPAKDTNGLRLVMKNGILVPKQRRFRTDRPHVCETCKRAFTLKSNRDRHVKNQHPTDWHKKPRSLSSKSEPQFTVVRHEQDTAPISDHVKMALSLKCRQSDPQHQRADDDEAMDEDDEDDDDDVAEEDKLVIVEDNSGATGDVKPAEVKEESADLASVSRLLDNASHQTFPQFNRSDEDHNEATSSEEEHSEGASYSENDGSGNNAGGNNNIDINFNNDKDESREKRKKVSAYAAAPNRVLCPFCYLSFPWTSSLKRHIRTHTGEKPYQCKHCPLSFSTKSNRDRHILRLHCTPPSKSAASSSDNETTVATSAKNVYKCTSCPKTTFSKRKNLISHINRMHFDKNGGGGGCGDEDERGDGGTDDGGDSERDYATASKPPGVEGINGASTTIDNAVTTNYSTTTTAINANINPITLNTTTTTGSEPCFKCHLCDSSYLERQGALDHIRINHAECYEILVSQGAMESDHDASSVKQDDVENRKVLCAFCLHRFYSAEDLRRHMRTHTKEQPFACQSCKRRFTLKHSMVRHIAKKHGGVHDHYGSTVGVASDHEPTRSRSSSPAAAVALSSEECTAIHHRDHSTDTGLIGTLLGIRDSTVIDQMLQTKSPEDAAKVLGIKSND